LFSLLGTTSGGDGKSTFGLPNMQGSTPMQQGQGPGLSLRVLGEVGGEQFVSLIQTEIPIHAHTAIASGGSTNNSPVGNVWGSGQKGFGSFYAPSVPATNVQMSPAALSLNGGGQPHNNMMPFLTLNFCIALQGIFPARS
jgi:microcystin-dependent protein